VDLLSSCVIIVGFVEWMELSQKELIEESNSGTRNHRGVRKKKERIRGSGRSVGSRESILNVRVYIW